MTSNPTQSIQYPVCRWLNYRIYLGKLLNHISSLKKFPLLFTLFSSESDTSRSSITSNLSKSNLFYLNFSRIQTKLKSQRQISLQTFSNFYFCLKIFYHSNFSIIWTNKQNHEFQIERVNYLRELKLNHWKKTFWLFDVCFVTFFPRDFFKRFTSQSFTSKKFVYFR